MDAYDLYATYQAVKLHFTSKTYNYFQYDGRTRVSKDSFCKRRDRFFFQKLARKIKTEDLVEFLVSNFIVHGDTWSKKLLEPEAQSTYMDWQKRVESLSYLFKTDVDKILQAGDIEKAFTVKDGQWPDVLTMFTQHEISIETMVILNNIIRYLDKWDRQITDDVVYPKIALKIRKYGAFLSVDVDQMKKVLKSALKS